MALSANEIVYKDASGLVLTRDDLRNISGQVKWEIVSKLPVPEEARRFHELGRAAAQRGESAAAIASFEKAAKVAPEWPYPVYDAAFTYLLQRDFAKAFDLYRKVDQMAPRGFFTVKTAVNTLRREQEGRLPVGTYLAYVSLEWLDEPTRRESAARLTERLPQFAPGWKARAALEGDGKKRMSYLEQGLAAEPDAETRGFLLLNKAMIHHETGNMGKAVSILGKLALDRDSPIDIETLAKQSLAHIYSN